MKSEFERTAAQAAVDAVEARWRRDEAFRRKANRKKIFNNIFAVISLGLIAVAGFYGYGYWKTGSLPPFLSALTNFIQEEEEEKNAQAEMVENFTKRLKSVLNSPLVLSKDLPDAYKPKKAIAGTTYLALSSNSAQGFQLYMLTADGHGVLAAARCSPLVANQTISWSVFKKEIHRPFLVTIEGKTYLVGSANLKDGEKLVQRIRTLTGIKR